MYTHTLLMINAVTSFDPAITLCVCVSDCGVYVLWGEAQQVGSADISARLHEEPAGVSSRTPSPSLEIFQLHVYACWVRKQTHTQI